MNIPLPNFWENWTEMKIHRRRRRRVGDVVSESDSVIMQLVNKIINDAYNRRASDIHVEPNVTKKMWKSASELTEIAPFIRQFLSVTATPLFRVSKSCPIWILLLKDCPRTGRLNSGGPREMKLNCVWQQFQRKAVWKTLSCVF